MWNADEIKSRLVDHSIYRRVKDLPALRIFMASHVFAVWDFMTLLKTLQRKITCVEVPWTPAADATSARFINEIVLTEESDLLPSGQLTSHFELYLGAMREVGADTAPIQKFLEALRRGENPERALRGAGAPREAIDFTLHTLHTAQTSELFEVAAAFFYGREDLIPAMFTQLLNELPREECPLLRLYLARHIAVDRDEHGPAARRLLAALCGDDAPKQQRASLAAQGALAARLQLWDAVAARLLKITE